MRVRVDNTVIAFEDLLQGRIEQNLAREVGDFVVRRADGLFAYQLAVVVDDFDQSITDVVRGADLLASTARQILLQRLLGQPTPRYMHLPVAVNQAGEKLSKQTRAAPLTVTEAPVQLWQALRFLGQEPPAELSGSFRELAIRAGHGDRQILSTVQARRYGPVEDPLHGSAEPGGEGEVRDRPVVNHRGHREPFHSSAQGVAISVLYAIKIDSPGEL